MADLLKALDERVVVGDGAMGTQIYAKGVTIGRCFDELNLTHSHLVRVIHREYAEAGAEFLETNTFTANRLRLRKFDLEKKVREINVAGAALAREVAGNDRFVGGSVGPLTGVKREEDAPGPDEKYEVFAEQVAALAEGGADALILETFTDLDELLLALRAARDRSKLPVICQMAFVENLRTPLGTTADRALAELEKAGAGVIGAPCTVRRRTTKVIERMGGRAGRCLSGVLEAVLAEAAEP